MPGRSSRLASWPWSRTGARWWPLDRSVSLVDLGEEQQRERLDQRKVAGKTLTVRLTPEQAERYREQIANRRRLDEIVAALEDVSAQAREVVGPTQQRRRGRSRPS